MRSRWSSVGGRHSVVWLTRRLSVGSVCVGSTAPTQMPAKNRYSTPEAPGHWPEGSLDVLVNGLPTTPMFVTFIHMLQKVLTLPGPKISGTALGPSPPGVRTEGRPEGSGTALSSPAHTGPAQADRDGSATATNTR